MTLYELKEELVKAAQSVYVDEETGEVVGGEELDALNIAFDEKLEGCAVWYKELMANIAAMKEEEKRLVERRKTLEKSAEWFEGYVYDCMTEAGKDKFETPKCVVKFRKSTAVNVIDEAALPTEYKVVKTVEQPDKKKIADAIKSGEIVAGAELVERKNVSIK